MKISFIFTDFRIFRSLFPRPIPESVAGKKNSSIVPSIDPDNVIKTPLAIPKTAPFRPAMMANGTTGKKTQAATSRMLNMTDNIPPSLISSSQASFCENPAMIITMTATKLNPFLSYRCPLPFYEFITSLTTRLPNKPRSHQLLIDCNC